MGLGPWRYRLGTQLKLHPAPPGDSIVHGGRRSPARCRAAVIFGKTDEPPDGGVISHLPMARLDTKDPASQAVRPGRGVTEKVGPAHNTTRGP